MPRVTLTVAAKVVTTDFGHHSLIDANPAVADVRWLTAALVKCSSTAAKPRHGQPDYLGRGTHLHDVVVDPGLRIAALDSDLFPAEHHATKPRCVDHGPRVGKRRHAPRR
jgi:hypothetical protein